VVSSTAWGAQRIEELLHQSLGRAVFSAGNGEVEVYEIALPAWTGRPLAELLAGTDVLAVAVTRAGRSRIPEPALVLEEGDVLYVSATRSGIEALRGRVQG
jgi:trk system potassium uptake protein TrkA